jgi:O-antigen/teichoic acid export membrane protein
VVTTLYGDAYAAAAPLLTLLAAGYFVQAMTGPNGLTIKVYNRLRYAVGVDVFACLLNLALNLLCIPRWGALGAAVATGLTLLVHNGLKQAGLRRLIGIRLFDRDYGRVVALALGLVAGCAALNLVWEINLAGACAIVALASLLLTYASRDALQIAAIFPELLRVPLLRRLLESADAVR